jgi:hypothetical protein
VNASRSLTYELPAAGTIGELGHAVRANVDRMAADLEAGTTVPG